MKVIIRVNLPEILGDGYSEFWKSKKRYRAVKGGRASKKSTTEALWLIYNTMKYKESNSLVVRRFFNGHKDSTFAQLKWAINKLHVKHLWKASLSPLSLTYKPTGQKILFRGMDDPMSLTSITVETGYLCWVWVEEAYQIENENDFNKLDLSIRGEVPSPLFKQITLTFNPWNEKHWLKKRFFDEPDEDTISMTTDYRCNEFLDDADRKVFKKMKEKSPRRYLIEGLGGWGVAEGLIYETFVANNEKYVIKDIDKYLEKTNQKIVATYIGGDWGHNGSANAAVAVGVTEQYKELIILDEFYTKEKLDPNVLFIKLSDFIERVSEQYGSGKVYFDNAEGMLVRGLRNAVIKRGSLSSVKECFKHKIIDRINLFNILFSNERIKINQNCKYLIDAFNGAFWDEKKDKNSRLDDGTSNIDSLDSAEYAVCKIMKQLVKAGDF